MIEKARFGQTLWAITDRCELVSGHFVRFKWPERVNFERNDCWLFLPLTCVEAIIQPEDTASCQQLTISIGRVFDTEREAIASLLQVLTFNERGPLKPLVERLVKLLKEAA
jgi:hypothetical protein